MPERNQSEQENNSATPQKRLAVGAEEQNDFSDTIEKVVPSFLMSIKDANERNSVRLNVLSYMYERIRKYNDSKKDGWDCSHGAKDRNDLSTSLPITKSEKARCNKTARLMKDELKTIEDEDSRTEICKEIVNYDKTFN